MHAELVPTLRYGVELFGILAFAACGAFQAVRADCSLFGTTLLSGAVGLGGGLARDLILGVQPVAFNDLGYLLMPCCVAVLVFFTCTLSRTPVRLGNCRLLDVGDAMAVGIASVTGSAKALDQGVDPAAAIVLGVGSAIGGGIASSLLIAEVPAVLRSKHQMLIMPAVFGSAATAGLHVTDHLSTLTASVAIIVSFAVRVEALRRSWKVFVGPGRWDGSTGPGWKMSSPSDPLVNR